jgi:hypothetical protein
VHFTLLYYSALSIQISDEYYKVNVRTCATQIVRDFSGVREQHFRFFFGAK